MEQHFQKHDRNQKQMLMRKKVAAIVLRLSFEEFHDISLNEMMEKYLVDDESLKEARIINGQNGEINLGDRQVRLDSLFSIRFPNGQKGYVNIEIQNDFSNQKRVISRVFVYDAFMIVLQVGVEINKQHYEDLKETSSIWIITDCPNKLKGNVIKLGVNQKNLLGHEKINQQYIDLISNVCIFLQDDDKIESEDMAILSALLNPLMDEKTKKNIFDKIGNKYQIEQEVNDMVEGNGRYLYEKGYGTGYGNGYGNGETDTILRLVKQLLEDHYDFNQIATLLHLSEDEQTKYRLLLNLQ